MNTTEIACGDRAEKTGVRGQVVRMVWGICLTAFLASSALAQYGGGGGMGMGTPGTPGYVAPKNGYGSGKAVGIGVGTAAGVGVAFLALHHHGAVTGCVRQTDDGLRLVDEKKNKSYALEAGSVDVKPGDLVELKGKRSSGNGGAQMFEPTKMIKNFGTCGPEAVH
jgi:microcystin-dependent protein